MKCVDKVDNGNLNQNNIKSQDEDYKEKYLRSKAELENYRKFMERQNSDYIKFANQKIILEFLKIYDDLKRSVLSMDGHNNDISKIKNGIKMILDNFKMLLDKNGIKSIESIGKNFNPDFHECIMIEKSESLPDNLIIDELEEGYCLNGKIIRPSRVKIIKN